MLSVRERGRRRKREKKENQYLVRKMPGGVNVFPLVFFLVFYSKGGSIKEKKKEANIKDF